MNVYGFHLWVGSCPGTGREREIRTRVLIWKSEVDMVRAWRGVELVKGIVRWL